jgi:hypothetical protein
MFTIVIGTRDNGSVKTLRGAHIIGKMHSENDARGQYVRVFAKSDVQRVNVLGEYLNGATLIKLTD